MAIGRHTVEGTMLLVSPLEIDGGGEEQDLAAPECFLISLMRAVSGALPASL